MSLAPIALFVYNRLEHTKKTVFALQQNELAENSHLYIYADGHLDSSGAGAVRDVRNYVRSISGFKDITIVEQENNIGLAGSLIAGITSLCEAYQKVIVIEDDIVTSPLFLTYMNHALDRYRDVAEVMHISGYMFPVGQKEKIPETFFYRVPSCWGWATWQRAWKNFNPDSGVLLKKITCRKLRKEFNILGSTNYIRMLKKQNKKEIDSWAIRWYASVFLLHGLCLHPRNSLSQNIGHDGTGRHCTDTKYYNVTLAESAIEYYPNSIAESKEAVLLMAKFYRSLRCLWIKRLFGY